MGVKYVSIKEACTLAGKSTRTIRYAISKGKLQSRKIKGARMIALPSLEKLYEIEKRGEKRESAIEDTVKTDNNDMVIDQLLERVKDLKSQIAEKDKQIARLDTKLDQQQKLTAQLQEKIPMLMPPEEQRRGGIWARLFGRG